MHVLILGASGGCGRWLTKLAVDRGHRVSAVVRPSADVPPAEPLLEIHRADVLDRADLEAAIDRAIDSRGPIDAVACCIGIRRRFPSNPWSRIVSPVDLTERVAQNLVDVMPRQRITRLVAISAAGVGDSAPQISPINRWLFDHSNVGVAYADLEQMERVLQASSLDWTAVRPVTLANGPPTGRTGQLEYYGVLSRIRRSDVAQWMLSAIERPGNPVRTPMIGRVRRGDAG